MKTLTLIALLLITVTLQAQPKQDTTWIDGKRRITFDYGEIDEGYHRLKPQKPMYVSKSAVGEILDQYAAYEKECYNDSTIFIRHWNKKEMWTESVKQYRIEDSIAKANGKFYPQEIFTIACSFGDNGTCIDMKHYVEDIKHREPTFTGFIEYLRKRQ